jgi:PAS domain S-box-containing protein
LDIPVVVASREGRVLFANAAAASLLVGLREGDSFSYPIQTGRSMEIRIPEGDGTQRYAELSATDWRWGDTPGYLVLLRDITPTRLASTLLLESESRFQAVIESVSQGVMAVNEAGTILWTNSTLEQMFGYESGMLTGKMLEILLPERFRSHHGVDVVRYFRRPEVRNMAPGRPLTGLRQDGSEFDIEVTLNYAEIQGERVALSFITDVTERRTMERQILQIQKMQVIGQLAGGVAHDFNNLLTVILGSGRMIAGRMSPDDPDRDGMMAILRAADRAASLTRQLLTLGRRQVIQQNVLRLNTLISGLERMLSSVVGEQIALRLSPAHGVWTIMADLNQLEQVLLNLALNARDAMGAGGTLSIFTDNILVDAAFPGRPPNISPGKFVRIGVQDTGHGMTQDILDHIFEPFFTTKEKGKGAGLGLATVYSIVQQHKGFLRVSSKAGEGSLFEVFVPATVEPEPVSAQQRESATETGGSETILLVEDEEGVRQMVRKSLQRRGYQVLEAATAEDAHSICREHTADIHLLLTDVIMPGITGPALAEQLRGLRPGLKVLFMSGYAADVIGQRGVPPDEIQFLQKPFTPRELNAKVRRALGDPK